MNDIKRQPDTPIDTSRQSPSDGWTVTPRAITTIATILAILYSLHAPVRYVLGVEQERAAAAEARLEAITIRDSARSR
jgi:hypothetical protein